MPVGPLEIGIVAAIALVLFGAKGIPKLGRRAGEVVRLGRDEARDFKSALSLEPGPNDDSDVEQLQDAEETRQT